MACLIKLPIPTMVEALKRGDLHLEFEHGYEGGHVSRFIAVRNLKA